MEMMGRGASLREVLDALTLAVEEMYSGCRCTVLLLDEERRHLLAGSGGSLPDAYMQAVNGLTIGPNVGACGSAAYRNETVVVEDISSDPKFEEARDFVMSFGLRACWSVPIRDSRNNVLGTFAIYQHRPAKPQARELRIVEASANLGASALERLRASSRLRENEQRIKLAGKAASLGTWEVDFRTGTVTVSDELAAQLGYARAALRLDIGQVRETICQEDWAVVTAALDQASASGGAFHAEFRVAREGVTRWFRTEGRVEIEDGKPARVAGVSIDVTREKEMVARWNRPCRPRARSSPT
jgi:PAS domain-containing protein